MANPLILKIIADDKGNIAIDKLNKNIAKVGKTSKRVGDIIKGVLGAKLISQSVEAVKDAFRSVIFEAGKYEDKLKSIRGITQGTVQDLKIMHRTMMDNTNIMEHLGTASADAALEINKMGFTAVQTAKALPHILNLGTGSMVELGTAANVTMQTLRSFGKEIDEIEHVVNVIQSTVSGTSIGFTDFAESMKYVAPIVHKVNVGLEETSAMIGWLGNIGLKGSIAGTSMKNMFLNMLKPGEKVTDMLLRMQDEGLTLVDLLVKMKDEGMGITDFLEVFNLRALPGTLSLANVSEEVRQLTKDLKDEKVQAKDVADIMRESLIKQLQILRNNLFNIGNEFIVAAGGADNFKSAFEKISTILIDTQKWIVENDITVRRYVRSIASSIEGVFSVLANTISFTIKNSDKIYIILRAIAGVTAFKLMVPFVIKLGTNLASVGLLLKSFNPYLTAIVTTITAVDLIIGKYEKHVDSLMKKQKTLTDRTIENLEKQQMAISDYIKAMEKAESLKSDGYVKDPRREQRYLKSIAKELSVKYDIPKEFLTMISTIKSAKSQYSYLTNELIKLRKVEEKIIDSKTADTKQQQTFLQLLKSELQKREDVKKIKEGGKISSSFDTFRYDFFGNILGKELQDALKINLESFGKNYLGTGLKSITPDILGSTLGKPEIFTSSESNMYNFDLFTDTLTSTRDKLYSALTDIKLSIEGNQLGGIPSVVPGLSSSLGVNPLISKSPNLIRGIGTSIEGDLNINFDEVIKGFQTKLNQEEFEANIKIAKVELEESAELKRTIVEVEQLFNEIDVGLAELDVKYQEALSIFSTHANAFAGVTSDMLNLIDSMYTKSFQKEQNMLTKKLSGIKKERDYSIKMAGDSFQRKYQIEADYRKKEAALEKEKEQQELEYKKKKKTMDIIDATIKTSLAIVNALNMSPPPLGIAMSLIVGALGTVQIGMIASQNYKDGGLVKDLGKMIHGRGSSTSDSIPALLSDKEYVLKAKTVEALGGQQGVERMVDDQLSIGTTSGTINIYIENAYDDTERIREQYKQIALEEVRW